MSTLLQNPSDKAGSGGRKSNWPTRTLKLIEQLLSEGATPTDVANILDVPRSLVYSRRTKLVKDLIKKEKS